MLAGFPAPGTHWRGAPASSQGGLVQASTVSAIPPVSFLRLAYGQLRPGRALWVRSRESRGVPWLQTVLSRILEGKPACKCPPLPCQTQSWCCGDYRPSEECALSQRCRKGGGTLKGGSHQPMGKLGEAGVRGTLPQVRKGIFPTCGKFLMLLADRVAWF